MLYHQHEQLRVDFAENAPGLLTAPLLEHGLTFPQFEEQFKLPTQPESGQRLRQGQLGD
jgi:hypothetical protein